ncbi:hypothetical protein LTR36_001400 [Oleoguttula mirabilis]|uniref:Mitochondrial outer membrane transport complex Sam37/metaxin N-terminal domain-containing protein n=1 Tax=Oleoguttula mirabilis TaxID=1507867 RepID=A0AAV9JP96_9PEZI|nr:hypothetical protein LTR36_001400 [Oleoguttula mirabilis]
MQLFVLGPAFGLPSIDAGCNAAIALLQLRRGDEAWQLIPTANDQLHLPLLVDGDKQFAGFANISRHVADGDGDGHGREALDQKQCADLTAACAFLEANAQTLLDISLYVSYENYSATRSAFTQVLPWYANYMLPPKRRGAARARTEHLGISSIDVDNVHEDMSNRPPGYDGVGKEQQGFEVEAQKRASLLLPRKDTLRSLLQRPERVATFKLHALAENFFAPLQDMLGEKSYLVGSEMTRVDCLAYGYLSLMLYPKMPQDWLASTMRRKYRKLVEYTERIHTELRLQTRVEDVLSMSACTTEADVVGRRKACDMALPWSSPAASTLFDVTKTTIRELLVHVPGLRTSAQIVAAKPFKPSFWQTYFPALLGVTVTTIGVSLYYAFHTGTLIWPHGEAVHIFGRKRFSDYGHLGAALAGISLLSQQTTGDAAFHEQEVSVTPLNVDITVEGDKGP